MRTIQTSDLTTVERRRALKRIPLVRYWSRERERERERDEEKEKKISFKQKRERRKIRIGSHRSFPLPLFDRPINVWLLDDYSPLQCLGASRFTPSEDPEINSWSLAEQLEDELLFVFSSNQKREQLLLSLTSSKWLVVIIYSLIYSSRRQWAVTLPGNRASRLPLMQEESMHTQTSCRWQVVTENKTRWKSSSLVCYADDFIMELLIHSSDMQTG